MLVVKTTSPATSPPPAKLHPSKMAPSSRTTVARLRPCSKSRPCPFVHHLSANYSTHDPARQPPPEVGGIGRPAQQGVPLHRPLLREIHEREISRSTDADVPTPVDPASRGAAHRLNQPRERDATAQDQLRVEGRGGGLVAEEAGSGLLQRQFLLLGGVRRVVGGHKVQGTVSQSPRHAAALFLRSQGRVYTVHPVERGDQGIGE